MRYDTIKSLPGHSYATLTIRPESRIPSGVCIVTTRRCVSAMFLLSSGFSAYARTTKLSFRLKANILAAASIMRWPANWTLEAFVCLSRRPGFVNETPASEGKKQVETIRKYLRAFGPRTGTRPESRNKRKKSVSL